MKANKKYEIRVGSMFSDGTDKIYRVTWFAFAEGITYKYGEPVEDNVVHIDIYEANDLEAPIARKDFVHIQFIQPVPITKALLDFIGFTVVQHEGKNIYKYNNVYFRSLDHYAGTYTLVNIKTNEPFAVEHIHQVQKHAAEQ